MILYSKKIGKFMLLNKLKIWISDFYDFKLLDIALEPSKHDKVASNMSKEIIDHVLKSKQKSFSYQYSSSSQRALSKKWGMAQRGLTFVFDAC